MFYRGIQTPRNNKSTRPAVCAFICFLVFGYPDKTLGLVLEIVCSIPIERAEKLYGIAMGPNHTNTIIIILYGRYMEYLLANIIFMFFHFLFLC